MGASRADRHDAEHRRRARRRPAPVRADPRGRPRGGPHGPPAGPAGDRPEHPQRDRAGPGPRRGRGGPAGADRHGPQADVRRGRARGAGRRRGRPPGRRTGGGTGRRPGRGRRPGGHAGGRRDDARVHRSGPQGDPVQQRAARPRGRELDAGLRCRRPAPGRPGQRHAGVDGAVAADAPGRAPPGRAARLVRRRPHGLGPAGRRPAQPRQRHRVQRAGAHAVPDRHRPVLLRPDRVPGADREHGRSSTAWTSPGA